MHGMKFLTDIESLNVRVSEPRRCELIPVLSAFMLMTVKLANNTVLLTKDIENTRNNGINVIPLLNQITS